MTDRLLDRIVLACFWLSWKKASLHWAIAMAALDRAPVHHVRVQRRLKKLEHVAWRNCNSRAARLDREKRRLVA